MQANHLLSASADQSFVARITLYGERQCDMYDDHPGFAFYYRDDTSDIALPPFCSLERAQRIAERAFATVKQQKCLGYEDEDEGEFFARFVVLRDNKGHAVHEYALSPSRGYSWITDLPAPPEWNALVQQVQTLREEASEESRWDNFETSKRLTHQANQIARRLSIARRSASVVQKEVVRGLHIRIAYWKATLASKFDLATTESTVANSTRVVNSARRLGYFDAIDGLGTAPAQFEDYPELMQAWRKGADSYEPVAVC